MASINLPGALRVLAVSLFFGLLMTAVGCGSGGDGDPGGVTKVSACLTGGGPPIIITGTVLYTRLVLNPPGGIGPAQETRPARFSDVDVRLAGGGDCYGRGRTDASGDYSVTVMPPEGVMLEVAVFSRTVEDPGRSIIVHDADPPFQNVHSELDTFSFVSGPIAGNVNATVDLTVPYDTGPANRPGIGFGLLDTAVTCWDGVTGALGGVLPPAQLYCRLGNNATLGDASYFAPSTQSIAILGGSAGNPDNSDTDYFDDPIVAHEFGHFVERSIAHSMTRGGFHGGEPLEPGFSWSEGLATGFGCLLLGKSDYVDSTGTGGSALFAFDLEDVTSFDPPGIGGEFTVAEICWDLGDGGTGPADTDGDPGAVPLAELLQALDTFDPGTDGPYLGLFLDRIVAAPGASIDTPTMATLLSGPPTENQGVSYPLAGGDIWPIQIGLGGNGSGTLDSLPGPLKNQCRGITSSDWYQLTLPTAAVVNVQVTITPIGGSGDDLDLFLCPNGDVLNPIASSTSGSGTSESVNVSLNAGTYVIIVEAYCGGGGNRASYTMTVN